MPPIPFTNARDPASGDALVDAAGNRVASQAPALEAVRNVLATCEGSHAADVSLGPDYGVVQKSSAGVGAAWRAEVLRALGALERAGVIARPDATVTVSGQSLSYVVTFVDPQSPGTRQSTGARTLGL